MCTTTGRKVLGRLAMALTTAVFLLDATTLAWSGGEGGMTIPSEMIGVFIAIEISARTTSSAVGWFEKWQSLKPMETSIFAAYEKLIS